jgi:hypothetical protein
MIEVWSLETSLDFDLLILHLVMQEGYVLLLLVAILALDLL